MRAIVLCLICLAVTACQSSSEPPQRDRHHAALVKNPRGTPLKAHEIKSAPPEVAANRAAAAGELYLIGIDGFTLRVPGLSDAALERVSTVPVRVVEKTGDAVRGDEDVKWRAFARDYATRFNQRVFTQITSP